MDSGMKNSEYIELALRTESDEGTLIFPTDLLRLLHAGMGLTTEAGEFVDTLKKRIFYGKRVDRINLVEELGDLFWYIAIACDALNVSFEYVMKTNIAKLQKRFPQKFTSEDALNRDLDGEREILEGKDEE